jgi:hypothetical protein
MISGLTALKSLSRWPCGLRRGSAAAFLLGLRVRMLPGVWLSLLWVLCVVTLTYLRGADNSSGGVLPSVVCLWSWSLDSNEALLHYGLLRQGGNKTVLKNRMIVNNKLYNILWESLSYFEIPPFCLLRGLEENYITYQNNSSLGRDLKLILQDIKQDSTCSTAMSCTN